MPLSSIKIISSHVAAKVDASVLVGFIRQRDKSDSFSFEHPLSSLTHPLPLIEIFHISKTNTNRRCLILSTQ